MQRGALECVKTEVKSSHNAKRHTAPSEAKETQWGEHELASFPEKLGPCGLCYLLRPPRTELCMHNNKPWTNMWNEGVACRSSCALCCAADQGASFLETSSVAGAVSARGLDAEDSVLTRSPFKSNACVCLHININHKTALLSNQWQKMHWCCTCKRAKQTHTVLLLAP